MPQFVFHSPLGGGGGGFWVIWNKATGIFLFESFCVHSHLTIPGKPVFPVYEWVLLKETLPDKALNLLWVSAWGSLRDRQVQEALDRNSILHD